MPGGHDHRGEMEREAGARAPSPTGKPIAFLGAPASDEFTRTHQDLRRWRAGDKGAGDSIWRRYRPALELVLNRRLTAVRNPLARARLNSEDILHDAVTTILGKLADFEYRGPGSLFAWMQTIATSWVGDWVDHWEREKRSPWREQRLDDAPDDQCGFPALPDRAPGPLTELCNREQEGELKSAMTRLSERHHNVLLLRYYLGAGWDDIAAQLGSPSGEAARKDHARALMALRDLMARAGG